MTGENKIKQSLVLVVIVFVFLYGISFIPVEGEIGGVELKQINLFSELQEAEDDFYNDEFFEDWDSEETEDTLTPPVEIMDEDNSGYILHDNYNYASNSVFNAAEEFVKDESEKISSFLKSSIQPKGESKIVGNTKQMKYFFDALGNAKSQKVRIAHYGDSQIEGDLVTGDLRENLRKEFGGGGAGYLAFTSQDITFRVTTKHDYPEDKWITGSVFDGNEENLPFGISGESFQPKTGAWVTYETYRKYRSTSKFKEVYIIYSDAKEEAFTAKFDNKKESMTLSKGNGFKVAEYKSDNSIRSARFEFPKGEAAIFYGVFFEDGNGIYVDNFPLRGNSGEDLNKIPSTTLTDFNKLRDYKLIIFQFGKNAISGNYKRYEREMVKVIDKYKEALPNTSFLLISVQDSGFRTSSRITNLLKAQMNIAKTTNIAFWDLFKAMGGQNSMSKWVKNNPPLASADHTHFNLQGAQIVGEMLSEALINLYNQIK